MNTTIDDVDSHIVYSTSPPWRTDLWLEQSPPAYLSTTHRTQNPGAIAAFTFTGTAVYVYGHKAADHGYRDISVDGATPIRCDGLTGSQGSRVVIYWQDGLSPGAHELTIQHTGVALQWLNVDYFVVTSAAPETISQTTSTSLTEDSIGSILPSGTENLTGSVANSNPTSSPSSPTSNSSQSSSNVIIIGAVVAAAAVAASIALLWLLCARHRREAKKQADYHKDAAVAAWNSPAAIHTGLNATPYIIEPFNQQDIHPGLPNLDAAPMANVRHWGPYNSSGYHSQEGPQSTYSSAPPEYSAPPNRTHFQPLFVPVANPVLDVFAMPVKNPASTASAMPHSSHPAPSRSSTHTGSDSNQTRIETPDQTRVRYSGEKDSKTRYSGLHGTTLGSSSSSRPLSPATVDEPVPPPPQYE